ncbi:hypothetical protein SFR_6572 [Streptomyces sp. FR-008]|nr:hypothetical protein SFR_6572 [Streptomyces sp. FR-008]
MGDQVAEHDEAGHGHHGLLADGRVPERADRGRPSVRPRCQSHEHDGRAGRPERSKTWNSSLP